MSASDFHFSLMDNVDALHAIPNKRKAFYVIVQNLTDKLIPQVKVKLSGPPAVKLLIKTETYGGIPNRISKKRVFKVISKENGIFPLTATLTTGKGHKIELPITLQVGVVQEVSKIISLSSKPEAKKTDFSVNCPYCGDSIDEESKFCPHCGTNLTEVKKEAVKNQDEKIIKHCHNCGKDLAREEKFCAKCGQKVE